MRAEGWCYSRESSFPEVAAECSPAQLDEWLPSAYASTQAAKHRPLPLGRQTPVLPTSAQVSNEASSQPPHLFPPPLGPMIARS